MIDSELSIIFSQIYFSDAMYLLEFACLCIENSYRSGDCLKIIIIVKMLKIQS